MFKAFLKFFLAILDVEEHKTSREKSNERNTPSFDSRLRAHSTRVRSLRVYSKKTAWTCVPLFEEGINSRPRLEMPCCQYKTEFRRGLL